MPLTERLHQACPGIDLHAERDDDLAFLRDLYADVRAPELAVVPWSDVEKRSFTDSQFALQRSHYRSHYHGAEFLVIEQDGASIGRVYLHASGAEICVMEISIKADCRNRGIGTQLLRAVLGLAAEMRRDVTLHVEPSNPAQRLYVRLGFRLIEHRGAYDFLAWSKHAPLLRAGEGADGG
jgi:ribosomal protein S18 acetylase RimI-like enzyme